LALFCSVKLSPFPRTQAAWHSFLQLKIAPVAVESIQEAMGTGKDCEAIAAVKFLQSYLKGEGIAAR